jgi:hypothetical protein
MSKKICYICNKPIKWNDRYVLYELDPITFTSDKKIFSHKRTCNRKIWKCESYFARQHTRAKKVDTKVFNRNKYKRKKSYKLSKLCACGVCDHN